MSVIEKSFAMSGWLPGSFERIMWGVMAGCWVLCSVLVVIG